MTVFLIIVAVLAVLLIVILSLSATISIVYDGGWHTTLSVLFIEKEISISEILSKLLFPDKKEQEEPEAKKQKPSDSKKQEPSQQDVDDSKPAEPEPMPEPKAAAAEKPSKQKPAKQQKSNPIKKLWDDEGIVGILTLVSGLLDTANSAILTLIRGLHIYSLYVMIITGGSEAADIAIKHGNICRHYYPVKGLILSTLKVDNYDDYIQPDFLAPQTEFQLQFICSITVGLLLKVAFKAVFVFLKNLINIKKGDKRK